MTKRCIVLSKTLKMEMQVKVHVSLKEKRLADARMGLRKKFIEMLDLDDAEDVVVSGDSNGCLNERTDIATKKIAFLSSQCSFIEGSVDCKDLNVCVKCNKGGELKVCSSTNSCRLVVHESCSDSHMSFSTRGEFQCPFCAYSQALSEYMDIKKKVSLTQKDFVTFVCLEARKELKKQPCRSYRSKQHRSEHNDSVYISIDPNNQDNSKHINNQKRRRKLEFQEAGCSTLSSGDHSPSRGETVDATKGENASDKELRRKSMRVQKHKREYTYPDIPQLRRKKVSWTAAEEEKLKEGMRIFCTRHDCKIPWKKILAHGATVFLDGRTTMDLKDKWRNLCRASPK